MLDIERFLCNEWQENCYVLYDESSEAVIVDCGAADNSDFEAIVSFVERMHLTPVCSLCTHLHLDHIFGLSRVEEKWGLGTWASAADAFFIEKWDSVCAMFGVPGKPVPPMPVRFIAEGDVIEFGNGRRLEVMETPGHSPGSLCFYEKDSGLLLTGDLLFSCGVGRTDLPGGSDDAMENSLKKVMALPDRTTVYPGHGPSTKILFEKNNNFYI